MTKTKKPIKVAFIFLIILIILFNAIWFLNNSLVYSKYKKAVGYNAQSRDYSINKDGYLYYVKTPSYPQFTGNLSITKEVRLKEGSKSIYSCDIIIWPSLFGKSEIGITIEKYEAKTTNDMTGMDMQHLLTCYVDENLNLIGNYTNEQKKVFEENYTLVQETWSHTKEVFKI